MDRGNILPSGPPADIKRGRGAVGEHSRPLRFLITALVVAVWWGLGVVWHTNTSSYTLLGVPILLAFQLWIHRRPLLALWVRSAPPLKIDLWFLLIWFLFSLVPAYSLVMSIRQMDLWNAATAFAAILGAIGLAYALRALRGANTRQTVLYFLIAVGIGLLPLIPTLLLPQFVHMRVNGQIIAPNH
jgi:hypothetical protein